MADAKKALRRKIKARMHTLREAFGGYPAMQLYQSALGDPIQDADREETDDISNPESPVDID